MTNIIGDAPRARAYLRETGITATPDRVKEILGLKTSSATLGRKFREAAARGELIRTYYTNEQGRRIAQYEYNPEYEAEQAVVEAAAEKIDRLYDQLRDDGIVDLRK